MSLRFGRAFTLKVLAAGQAPRKHKGCFFKALFRLECVKCGKIFQNTEAFECHQHQPENSIKASVDSNLRRTCNTPSSPYRPVPLAATRIRCTCVFSGVELPSSLSRPGGVNDSLFAAQVPCNMATHFLAAQVPCNVATLSLAAQIPCNVATHSLEAQANKANHSMEARAILRKYENGTPYGGGTSS